MDATRATSAVEHDYVGPSWEFEEVYRAEYPGLIAVATALTGDRHDGEDLVQDTMVRAFLHWRRVARYERPGAWCMKVLTNLCHNRWRRQRVERRYATQLRQTDTSVPGPSDDVLAFWAATRLLPTRPRTVVALYFAGDHSTAEVATMLGIPEGTVRSDLTRARTLIRRELSR